LCGDERGVNRIAVSGNDDARVQQQQFGHRGGPVQWISIGEVGVSALLDEVASEEDTGIGRPHRKVVVGMSAARMGQQHPSIAEADADLIGDRVVGYYWMHWQRIG
jgi:hypothetical protein